MLLSLFVAPAYADQVYDNSWPIEVTLLDSLYSVSCEVPNFPPFYKISDLLPSEKDLNGGLAEIFYEGAPNFINYSLTVSVVFSSVDFCVFGAGDETISFVFTSVFSPGTLDFSPLYGGESVYVDVPESGLYIPLGSSDDGEDPFVMRLSKNEVSFSDIITESGGGLTSLLGVVWDLIISNPLLLFFAGAAIVSLGVVFFHKARGNAR